MVLTSTRPRGLKDHKGHNLFARKVQGLMIKLDQNLCAVQQTFRFQ